MNKRFITTITEVPKDAWRTSLCTRKIIFAPTIHRAHKVAEKIAMRFVNNCSTAKGAFVETIKE